MERTALIAGATGLIGKELTRLLLTMDFYSRIIVLARSQFPIKDRRLDVVVIPDFDQLSAYRSRMDAHDYYCLLGTTMKKAGSRANFLKVDYEYPMQLAAIAKESPSFEQYLLVTALGANPNSPLFYNRVKGKLEEDLKALRLGALKIFQPNLLLGNREEFRWGEAIAKAISSFFSSFVVGKRRRLWAIRATDVATAMFRVARENEPGLQIYTPSKMRKLIK